MRRLSDKQLKQIRLRRTTVILLATLGGVLVLALVLQFALRPRSPVTTVITPKPSPDTSVHAGPEHDTTSPSSTPVPTNPANTPSGSLDKPIGPNNNTSTITLSGPSTMMESTCRSVTGATCYIKAVKGSQSITVSQTKSVTGVTDGVILDWDAKQLSAGTWSIYAVAQKDGQQATSDPQTLEVKP